MMRRYRTTWRKAQRRSISPLGSLLERPSGIQLPALSLPLRLNFTALFAAGPKNHIRSKGCIHIYPYLSIRSRLHRHYLMPSSGWQFLGLSMGFESKNERRISMPGNGVILPFITAVGVFWPYRPVIRIKDESEVVRSPNLSDV